MWDNLNGFMVPGILLMKSHGILFLRIRDKVANGYSGHVFKRSGQPFLRKKLLIIKNAMYSSSHCFKIR